MVEDQLFQPFGIVAESIDVGNQARVCRNHRVATPFLSRVATIQVFILVLNNGSAKYEGGDVGSTGVARIISQHGIKCQLQCEEFYEENRED